jgi:pre-mRNA-processing factor SLU7
VHGKKAGDSSDEDSDNDKAKIAAGNLRVREDTAKYLRNLDPNSAPYDPKSRSMKENPNPLQEDQDFRGDNFVKTTGDYMAFVESEGLMVQANRLAQE